jgi:hypothetical protein
MSLLQKAIRRDRKDLALRATATLLHGLPERLWRRLACIAFEDIGIGDLDTVALVTAAMAGKRFRSELGGEWRVGSFLTSRMSEATKCRAADDVLLAAENHQKLWRATWPEARGLPNPTRSELVRATLRGTIRCRARPECLFRAFPPGRIGYLSRASWVPTWQIRAQTRHASDAMLARYIRDGELFIENAAGALL